MAIRQYIGARYVPKFMGTYNPTQVYEALDVVDNGQGTSYISKIPTPAGTPLTDTTYWAIYGASSGAIINLQDQINDMQDGTIPGSLQSQISANDTDIANLQKNPVKRKYVLIGDSFGVGIVDASTPWTTGWEDYMYNLFPGDVFYYNAQTDPQFAGTAGFTTTSSMNFIGQLEWVFANKLGTTPAESITDVVIMGGSNEIGAQADIEAAIATFCSRSRVLFPNANIAIAVLGLQSRKMMNNGVYAGYSNGAAKNGAAFYKELFNLGSKISYDSGLGHWSVAGYAYYDPIIAKCIVSGHTDYQWYDQIPLTLGSDVTIDGSVQFDLIVTCTEKGVFTRINCPYNGWILKNAKTIAQGIHTVTAFILDTSVHFYTSIQNGAALSADIAVFRTSDNLFDSLSAKMYPTLDINGQNNNNEIRIGCWRRLSYPNASDLGFALNMNYDQRVPIGNGPIL